MYKYVYIYQIHKQQVFLNTFLEFLLWKAITLTISFQMDENFKKSLRLFKMIKPVIRPLERLQLCPIFNRETGSSLQIITSLPFQTCYASFHCYLL